MTTLTASTTFTVGDASVVTESASLLILPASGAGEGKGRLVHPTLGTYDYPKAPDEWTDMDGDAIIRPIWSTTRTLDGAANTLWQGKLRHVECTERWTADDIAMSVSQLRMLIAMWSNPPDPTYGRVKWYPSYVNGNAYEVALVSLTSGGGEAITLNHVIFNSGGYVNFDVVLRLRILGRADA